MFGKKKKKLDRRMRRRIRKTSAVMLLISAITVAAIPVPEAEAAPGDAGVVAYAEGDPTPLTHSVKAEQSAGLRGLIPYVTDADTIYTSDNGSYKFAYLNIPGEEHQAILLEYTGSAVDFVIPETLRAYIQYTTSQGTQNGYVAANQNGQPLFYKEIRPIVYERIAQNRLQEAGAPTAGDNTSWSSLSRKSEGSYTIVKDGQSLPGVSIDQPRWDDSRNVWIQEVQFYTYRYVPCMQREVDNWSGDDVFRYLFNENSGAPSAADALLFYRFPDSNGFTQWNINSSEITTSYTEYINDGNSEGKGYFSGPASMQDDWLQNASVGYISDQTVDASGATWKVGPSRGTNPFLSRGANVISLTIPETMIAIADYSFYECASLQSVNLGQGSKLANIGSYAFAGCTNMTTFSLAANSALKVISDHMLENCQKLTGFTVPNATTTIADSAFSRCYALSSVNFSGAGLLTEIGNYVFSQCRSLQEVSMPRDLSKMGWYNFEDCTGLKKVVLESNVGTTDATKIRFNNFKGCSSLECIDVRGNQTTFDETETLEYNAEKFKEEVNERFYFIGEDSSSAIHDVTKNNAIAFMYRQTEIYEKINRSQNKNGDDVEITYQVNKNNELVLLDVKGEPDEVVIEGKIGPYDIKKLGSQFNNSSTRKLESITIPTTIEEIGADAFKGCTSLKEVHFQEPNKIKSIGENAFQTQYGGQAGAEGELTFYGDIREDSYVFNYAMNPANKINDDMQKNTYIDFCSGKPANIHVHYDPERGNSTLWKVPTTPSGDALDIGEQKEYMDAITEVLKSEYTGPDPDNYIPAMADIVKLIDEYRTTGTLAGRSPALQQAVGSAFDIRVPSGVKSIAKNLFSKASEDDAKNTQKKSENKTSGASIIENAMLGIYTKTDDPDAPVKNFSANNDIRSITMCDIEELDPYAFYGCSNLNTVHMYSSGVEGGEKIGDYAFGQCENLGNDGYVLLPDSTSEMGIRPFAGDERLTGIQFVGEASTTPGIEAAPMPKGDNFQCDKGIIFELKNGTKDAVVECLELRGNPSVGSIEIDASELAGVNRIYNEAFMNCDRLTNVDMSASNVTAVPEFCFNNAENLTYLTLPNTCETVGHYAMKDTGLKRLTVNNATTAFETDSLYETEQENDDRGNIINHLEVVCVKDSRVERWVSEHAMYDWVVSDKKVVWQYTITFYDSRTEDGTGEMIKTVRVDEGTDVPEPTEEEMAEILKKHEGKYFVGWSPDNYEPAWKDMDVAAVYADERPDSYKVIFMNDGGVLLREYTIQHGNYIPAQIPPTSTHGNFTFTGWSNADGYSIYEAVTSDRTFYANYNYQGGTTSGNDPNNPDDPNNPNNPDDPNNPNNPDDPNNPNNPNDPNNPNNPNDPNNPNNPGNGNNNNNGNQTLYTLTVVNGSGSGSYAADTQVTVAAYTPNTGYEFYNWTSSENDTNFTSKTLAATSFKMPAKNLTITANYRTKTETGNSITSKRGQGTITSAPSSNTGSVSKGNSSNSGSNSGNSGSSVQVNRPGISNTDVASATVNGSTDNFVVKITEDGQATAAVAEALRNEYGDLANIRYFAMDISLYDETGTTKITDTSGLSVTITLPIPDELRQYAGNNKVAAVTGGNNLDKLNPRFTTVNGVPCVTFTATHFSPYTIYVDTANLSEGAFDSTPKTGDAIHPKWFLAIGLGLFSAVLFLKKDKKVRHSAA